MADGVTATASIVKEVIRHDGFETKVNLAGAPDLPAVLLLHGSGPGASAWSNWQYIMPELADRFFLVAPDLAGFAESSGPGSPPLGAARWMEVWVDQVISLIEHMRLKRVNLVGNSLGGAIALQAALRRVDAFDRIALMGPVGTPVKLTRELDLIWGFYDSPSVHRMESAMRWFAWDPSIMGDQIGAIAKMRFEAAMQPRVREMFARMFPAPRQQHLDAMTVADSDLRRITQPVLLLHGQEDPIVPIDTSEYLIRHLGGPVQMHVYNRCSHWTQVEYKDSFNRLVADFFADRI